ncbi:long-chain fatty acid--CoA ligase [Agromyces mediolanus]|uniref:AMP-binding enzyme n=1 Tax=Agromyces mediolanus TaxID=41986 RepID=UPI003836F71D
MSGWLRGRVDRTALAIGGRALDYGGLGAAAAAFELPADGAPVFVGPGADPLAALVAVLAGLERGRRVVVGAGEAPTAALPPGTELALTTSGSSDAAGRARIVARTNASWLASAAPLAEVAGIAPGAVVLLSGPLHVSMHLYAALHTLFLGGTLTDEPRAAEVVHATPTRLLRLLDSPAVPATAIVAGAAVPEALRELAAARGVRLIEYYGAAELSFVGIGEGGALAAFPGVEVELRDAAAGAGLELWARSPYLALGVQGGGMLRRDERGFATVGDLAEPVAARPADPSADPAAARPSAAGASTTPPRFRVLGRGDAAITVAGATVLAEEVEHRLAELPGVAAAVVLGEPDELLGQRLVAVVELVPGADPEPAIAAAGALPAAWRPRRWHQASSVPVTASGKPARGVVASELRAGRLPRIDRQEVRP